MDKTFGTLSSGGADADTASRVRELEKRVAELEKMLLGPGTSRNVVLSGRRSITIRAPDITLDAGHELTLKADRVNVIGDASAIVGGSKVREN